jgi:hypothetical protein
MTSPFAPPFSPSSREMMHTNPQLDEGLANTTPLAKLKLFSLASGSFGGEWLAALVPVVYQCYLRVGISNSKT